VACVISRVSASTHAACLPAPFSPASFHSRHIRRRIRLSSATAGVRGERSVTRPAWPRADPATEPGFVLSLAAVGHDRRALSVGRWKRTHTLQTDRQAAASDLVITRPPLCVLGVETFFKCCRRDLRPVRPFVIARRLQSPQ